MRIETDPLIQDQILFDTNTNTISFKGDQIKDLINSTIARIKITLVNGAGENKYLQTVFVIPS